MRHLLTLLLVSTLAGCGTVGTPMAAKVQGKAQAIRAAGKSVEPAVATAAEKWIKANAGGEWEPSKGKLFPGVNDGEQGLEPYAWGGTAGTRVAEFADAWFKAAYRKPPVFSYDPAKNVMLAVQTTQDEPVLYMAVFDKATGKGQFLDTIGIVDLSTTLKQPAFDKFFPGLGPVGDVDYEKVLESLYKSATPLVVR
ncbi:MAG: hypothetical protein JWM80_1067 [Cyanobacteria bacterium RYN_339]|nr:hypothetical protein [Cyanobacteria bacterium RYN_339]